MYGFINQGIKELITIQRGQKRTKRVRLSRRMRQRLFWRDSGRCVYCDKALKFSEMTVDHVQPLTQKGNNRSKENMATACLSCNTKKGPLVMQDLEDLSPWSLAQKFSHVTELAEKRKGSFIESMW